jgi:hypothetical protein
MLIDGYKLTCEEVLKHFETDPIKGLRNDQVILKREKFGLNGNKVP